MARTTARNTPAKKTTARKTAAKKTTARKTAAKTTQAKKTTEPRLSLVKPAPEQPRLSLVKPVDLRAGLPTRPQPFMTDTQGYATLAARIAGIPTHRINDWRDHHNNTATRPLRDGATLHYDHNTRTLTLHTACPMGAVHEYRLTTPSSATAARIAVDRCNTPHADLTHLQPLSRDEWEALGIHTGPTWARPDLLDETPTETIPVPLPTAEPGPRALADQLTHSTSGTADTQPMSHQQIAAYIAEHTDNAKEHPEP
ncbi:hypothetical protein ABZ485_27950 [Streptomyces albogriseolus]|uniref:hypothetical protein n=1 Tax=Streptomyces albogriseolus TaxID=1887 RepID=UPI00346071A2